MQAQDDWRADVCHDRVHGEGAWIFGLSLGAPDADLIPRSLRPQDNVLAAQTKDKKRIHDHEIEVHVAWKSCLYVTNFPESYDKEAVENLFSEVSASPPSAPLPRSHRRAHPLPSTSRSTASSLTPAGPASATSRLVASATFNTRLQQPLKPPSPCTGLNLKGSSCKSSSRTRGARRVERMREPIIASCTWLDCPSLLRRWI